MTEDISSGVSIELLLKASKIVHSPSRSYFFHQFLTTQLDFVVASVFHSEVYNIAAGELMHPRFHCKSRIHPLKSKWSISLSMLKGQVTYQSDILKTHMLQSHTHASEPWRSPWETHSSQVICFAFHDSKLLMETCQEAKNLRKIVTLFYLD
ncbi:hypothetical protein Syun_025507 [Stephania yunnanensis]|uniref:Uncharacterized protein n=1 Tax=Stephania yunnanensis TaxID=152371 RepID=A0AAP0EX51_9MAGN